MDHTRPRGNSEVSGVIQQTLSTLLHFSLKPGIGSFGSSIRGDDPESTSLLVVMISVEL